MVVETKFYDILSISPNATTDEISKSYKKIALKCHPDKTNHDPQLTERFKTVTRAYEVLKDDNMRKAYDMYGESGLDGRIAQSNKKTSNFKYRSATDVFSQVFSDIDSAFGGRGSAMPGMDGFGAGMGGGFDNFSSTFSSFGFPPFSGGAGVPGGPSAQGMKKSVRPVSQPKKTYKSEDIHHVCKVSLEDLASGKIVKLQLPRKTKCDICHGDGGFDRTSCKVCEGMGRVSITMSNQFTKYQSIGSCVECRGRGAFMSSVCDSCDDGYVVTNEIIQLQIPPGARDGDRIVLKHAADEGRDTVPGDVVVQLKQAKHPFLVRQFNDLYMEHDIDLRTALLGGSIVINDFLKKGRDIRVFINVHGDSSVNNAISTSINEGEVVGTINPGTPKLVKGLGMPINHTSNEGVYYDPEPTDSTTLPRGDLFIKFNVRLPSVNDFGSMNDLVSLANLLPHTAGGSTGEDVVDVHLSNLPEFQDERNPKRHRK